MLRRKFITLFGGAAAIWPLAASAQQPTMPVIGFLSGATFETMREYVVAFHRGLADAGSTSRPPRRSASRFPYRYSDAPMK
jgi:putative tryptophan/tyrosine transport system substrate-binding protein